MRKANDRGMRVGNSDMVEFPVSPDIRMLKVSGCLNCQTHFVHHVHMDNGPKKGRRREANVYTRDIVT